MTATVDRIAITSPAHLAASVPSLVGFAPADSLVIVFVRDSHVIVTMRVDLDQAWPDITAGALAASERVSADTALLVVYADRGDDLPLRAEIQQLEDALEGQGITVTDALAVDAGRWWSYRCDGGCCPADGQLVDPGLDQVGTGSVLARRSDIAASYQRKPGKAPSIRAVKEATTALAADPRERAERAWEALQHLAATAALAGRSGDDLRALVQLSCLDVRCRDYLLGRVCGTEDADLLVEAFVDAALRSHDETLPRMAGAAAALLAATCTSTVPVGCMVELAGTDSLAQLVEQAIRIAVPPATYKALLVDALPETIAALEGAGSRA